MQKRILHLLSIIIILTIGGTGLVCQNTEWPVMKTYDQNRLERIALPLGGIGTGTVSLGGRGNLRDWEIMNRPAKGFIPNIGQRFGPFFAIFVKTAEGKIYAKALEGPLPISAYENSHGSTFINHGLPRFKECTFVAAYPFGQVMLSDPDFPVTARLEAFNPLVPGDTDISGIPVAILRYVITNASSNPVSVSVCGNLPNFIGQDGSKMQQTWTGDWMVAGGKDNRNQYRKTANIQGIMLSSQGIDPHAEQWGTIALTTSSSTEVSHRTAWLKGGWGTPFLDFWDDFSQDGRLDEREIADQETPMASLAVEIEVPARGEKSVTFLLTWHFPNRYTWTPNNTPEDMIGNYYTTQYPSAWMVAESVSPQLEKLEQATLDFVDSLNESTFPEVVKEAALFNISTLRTQTCFRTQDGRFFGFEGSSNTRGCCHGSCTHVWNYEQATAFLFGNLARSMRDTEFNQATDKTGLMSFRVSLPIDRAQEFGKAAADGQMGCIMKVYREWQMSGNEKMLAALWPNIKKALEFCWIEGGWDADKNGVMEGAQHNTMDVEYYGPNPQMGIWYLGALRAAEEMAAHLGEKAFAQTCRRLFENGSAWIDDHLFNGEYYEQKIQPPKNKSEIAPSLLIGMGAQNPTQPDYQLGKGCLVDQLVGQYMAHVCGLGYLVTPEHVRTTLKSIMKYNLRESLHDHFNCLRSFALGDESALLMASYPHGRPQNPFPYFTEVMSGFEYTAAVGMLYEDQTDAGIRCIRNIRDRYDGYKRNPFDEAECGHHYARAMASWAALLALSGFHYSAVDKIMKFDPKEGRFFWSNGAAWGVCTLHKDDPGFRVTLKVKHGELRLNTFVLTGLGKADLKSIGTIDKGEHIDFIISSSNTNTCPQSR